MTMFTRNEKGPEAPARPAGADKPEATAQIISEPKRPIEAAPVAPTQATSLISRALKITGQLESTENIEIEGQIEGDVRGVRVKVGQNAKVKGSVYGEEVELAGTVDGKIEAKKVVLTSTAHMSGDVIHQDIAIQSGAYIAGHCRPEFGKSETKFAVKPLEPIRREEL